MFMCCFYFYFHIYSYFYFRAREFDSRVSVRRAHENLEGGRGWESGIVFYSRAGGYAFEDFEDFN